MASPWDVLWCLPFLEVRPPCRRALCGSTPVARDTRLAIRFSPTEAGGGQTSLSEGTGEGGGVGGVAQVHFYVPVVWSDERCKVPALVSTRAPYRQANEKMELSPLALVFCLVPPLSCLSLEREGGRGVEHEGFEERGSCVRCSFRGTSSAEVYVRRYLVNHRRRVIGATCFSLGRVERVEWKLLRGIGGWTLYLHWSLFAIVDCARDMNAL